MNGKIKNNIGSKTQRQIWDKANKNSSNIKNQSKNAKQAENPTFKIVQQDITNILPNFFDNEPLELHKTLPDNVFKSKQQNLQMLTSMSRSNLSALKNFNNSLDDFGNNPLLSSSKMWKHSPIKNEQNLSDDEVNMIINEENQDHLNRIEKSMQKLQQQQFSPSSIGSFQNRSPDYMGRRSSINQHDLSVADENLTMSPAPKIQSLPSTKVNNKDSTGKKIYNITDFHGNYLKLGLWPELDYQKQALLRKNYKNNQSQSRQANSFLNSNQRLETMPNQIDDKYQFMQSSITNLPQTFDSRGTIQSSNYNSNLPNQARQRASSLLFTNASPSHNQSQSQRNQPKQNCNIPPYKLPQQQKTMRTQNQPMRIEDNNQADQQYSLEQQMRQHHDLLDSQIPMTQQIQVQSKPTATTRGRIMSQYNQSNNSQADDGCQRCHSSLSEQDQLQKSKIMGRTFGMNLNQQTLNHQLSTQLLLSNQSVLEETADNYKEGLRRALELINTLIDQISVLSTSKDTVPNEVQDQDNKENMYPTPSQKDKISFLGRQNKVRNSQQELRDLVQIIKKAKQTNESFNKGNMSARNIQTEASTDFFQEKIDQTKMTNALQDSTNFFKNTLSNIQLNDFPLPPKSSRQQNNIPQARKSPSHNPRHNFLSTNLLRHSQNSSIVNQSGNNPLLQTSFTSKEDILESARKDNTLMKQVLGQLHKLNLIKKGLQDSQKEHINQSLLGLCDLISQ
eukprot:403341760